jgi:excisionase family DNA binding protein
MLKINQVAERLNCSVSTVYALIGSGSLGHHRCPGVRVSEEQLQAYLDRTKREREVAPRQRITTPRPRLKHISL